MKSDIEEIAEQLSQRNIVLFIGAGLSIGAGLPSWRELIRPLADDIGYDIPNDAALTSEHLLNGTQYFENEHGRHSLISYLCSTLATYNLVPTIVHDQIIKLPVQTIFTTNYDNLLEKAFSRRSIPHKVIVDELELVYQTHDMVQIIKLCGDCQRPLTISVTKRDFHNYFPNRPRLKEHMRTALETHRVLFLGYGLNDPFFNQIWDQIGETFGKHRQPAYGVVFDVTPLEEKDLKQRGIRIIKLAPTERQKRNTVLANWLKSVVSAL